MQSIPILQTGDNLVLKTIPNCNYVLLSIWREGDMVQFKDTDKILIDDTVPDTNIDRFINCIARTLICLHGLNIKNETHNETKHTYLIE